MFIRQIYVLLLIDKINVNNIEVVVSNAYLKIILLMKHGDADCRTPLKKNFRDVGILDKYEILIIKIILVSHFSRQF